MTPAVPPRRPRPTARPAPPARRPAPTAPAASAALATVAMPTQREVEDAHEAALQARVDAFFAARGEDDAPRPSRLARWGTRWGADGLLRRRACAGSIGIGVALFVTASLTTPLAGAETAGRHAASAPTRVAAPPAAAGATPDTLPAVPAARKTLPRRPTHAAVTAPTDHRAISGLAANGIPKVALNAYRVAAARLAHVEPGCGIDWALLAGIGREESDHGRFGGAVLHTDGISTPAIVGPALDGVHWDYIPVSADYERITGDATFAHALGPMQFIPTTWAAYGADADGDGRANVFDINDAALGTARYLCAAGGDLRTHAGQVAGVLAYNHSDQYLAQVLALADAYRRGVAVTGIPVGNTTGALPTITPGGYVPPANPGAPTAVDKAAQRAAAKKAAQQAAKKAAARKAAAARKRAAQAKASTSAAAPSSGSPHTSGGSHGSGGATTPSGGSTGTPSSSSPTPSPPSSSSGSTSTPAPVPSPTCRMILPGVCV